MKEIMMTGIFTLAGTIIGGMFAYYSSKIGFQREQLKKHLESVSHQWLTFHRIEEELLTIVSRLDPSQKKVSVKKMVRQKVYSKGARELYTPSEIKKMREEFR